MSDLILARDTGRTAMRISARRLGIAAVIATGCAGGAWFGHGWWTIGRFIEATDDAYVGGNVTTISPHVAGFVAAILVADNAHVQAGQLLVQLDRHDMQAAYDRALAVVAARAAALDNLRAQYALQQSTIAQSVADQAAKSARAVFTRIDGARYAVLASSNSGSRQDWQRAQATAAEAEAALTSSRFGLEAARQQIKVLDAQMSEAGAVLGQARAALQTASLNLGYTEIHAPVDGYVGNRAAQMGAYVSEGAYLLSVIPAHGLWVDANFKEDQLAYIEPGQSANAVADVAPGVVFHGHVLSLAPGTGAVFSVIPPENATGNFTKIVQRVPVRIALDADQKAVERLRPGLSIVVSVDTRGP